MSHKNYNYPTDIPPIFKLIFDNYNKDFAPVYESKKWVECKIKTHEFCSSEKEYVEGYCSWIVEKMKEQNVNEVRIFKQTNNPIFIQLIDNKPYLIFYLLLNSGTHIFGIELTELYLCQIFLLSFCFDNNV